MNLIPNSEEETYTMASALTRDSLPLVQDELPSRHYAKYLAETVLFHLGDIYHVFDRETFMEQLDHFYDEGLCNKPLKGLWSVQFLLVIAFGKLFLRRGASSLGPPGASDFLRAMKLQPDVLDLWDDPILRIEILFLISLYLNTSDMRATAYSFVRLCLPSFKLQPILTVSSQIGQAMRLALSLGMNREPPYGYLDQREYQRRRRLWWTLYILDKKLSVISGAPLSIMDEDIDISAPGEHDLGLSNTALNFHIKLAGLEGRVMSGIVSHRHYALMVH